ncbi:MAG: GNAT family N-acetyltransferase [Actinomycetota bacterium]
MSFAIRPADETEAEEIASLNGVVQQLHYERRPDWFKPPDATSFLPVVRAWLASETTTVFVATDDSGKLVGYSVGVRHERPDNALVHGATFVELDQVVVVPAARRQGVGRSLCTAVIDWAEAAEVDRVELSTWAFNHTAYRAFEGLGFSPTVRRMSRPVGN